ncbi:hypothetical protein CXB51_007976 [Gossypium anomalum]|uniref:Zinc finger matrin-type protein n=1 Tax=Gossypium anomalum TaxID=47600 RepID=A0A8J5YV35_9ROSI|nr:hypothetical protein CXB51_007976 [Gossypium anomalum]
MLSHLSPFPKSPDFSTSHSFFQLSQPTKRKGGRHSPHSSANVCGCNHPTMICLYLSQPYSASLFSLNPSLIPSSVPKFKPAFHCFPKTHKKKKKINRGICRAEFSPDAPLAAAIGACMLSSLLLPAADTGEEDGGSSIIDAGDTRFAAMGIISFIPYFNWLSWVFAWLDSGKRRYAVYSIVYLVPYLRSNFSLSPEDTWLPIASILFCIVHVQLEASIRNGDLQGFQIFSEAAKHLSSRSREEDEHFKGYNEPEVKKREHRNLPDAEEHSRNEIPHWGIPKRPSQHHEQLNDLEDDGKSEH